MKPVHFIEALCALDFDNAFNPYSRRCGIHDIDDAPQRRAHALHDMLEAATRVEVDSIWIGRDLGYRGGRRTGLALTDDVHIQMHAKRWGISIERPTRGDVVAERTAAVVWNVLSRIEEAVFLWNVFPLHPHEADEPFSNRSHNARERKAGAEILSHLIRLVKPSRLVAIGNDAAKTVQGLACGQEVIKVRHPSYGGQLLFVSQLERLYDLPKRETSRIESQPKRVPANRAAHHL